MNGTVAADVSGCVIPAFPMRKRKNRESYSCYSLPQKHCGGDDDSKELKRVSMSKAKEIRLEQNRKAARESRRRKKVMIEELQRSVIFFSRANGTLQQQNEELTRLLLHAQSKVLAIEKAPKQPEKCHPFFAGTSHIGASTPSIETEGGQKQPKQRQPQSPQQQSQEKQRQQQPQQQRQQQQQPEQQPQQQPEQQPQQHPQQQLDQRPRQNHQQRCQSQPEQHRQQQPQKQPQRQTKQHAETTHPGHGAASQSFDTRATPQTSHQVLPLPRHTVNAQKKLPPMQPGATMQAMANFQQAATAAIKAAIQGMQGVPGFSVNALAATTMSENPQQAYTDTITALNLQQAAAVTGPNVSVLQPDSHFIPHSDAMSWRSSQAPTNVRTPSGIETGNFQKAQASV